MDASQRIRMAYLAALSQQRLLFTKQAPSGACFFWSLHLNWDRIEGTMVVQNAGLGEVPVMTVMVRLNLQAICQTLLYKAAT